MTLNRMLLPLALVLGGLLVLATNAEAAPSSSLTPTPKAYFGGKVHGHGTVVVTAPIHRHRHHRAVVRSCGHYEWRTERLWVDGELIGYDRFGRAIFTEGYWTTRRYRVWVEAPCHPRVRRGHVRRYRHVHPAPPVHPHVSVGVGFGF